MQNRVIIDGIEKFLRFLIKHAETGFPPKYFFLLFYVLLSIITIKLFSIKIFSFGFVWRFLLSELGQPRLFLHLNYVKLKLHLRKEDFIDRNEPSF